jgi:ferredoxin
MEAMMAISKVWIEDGCISCSLCESTCPEVFEMQDIAVVKDGADFTSHETKIIEAAKDCPVSVIKYK